MEEWKDIPNYEGLYQASTYGRIKSLKRFRYNHSKKQIAEERILKPGVVNGYLRVSLWKDNKFKNYLVHRLIAMTFIPNPNNYKCINHKDETRKNNKVNNLEWCTHKYNNNYGTINQRRSKKRKELLK